MAIWEQALVQLPNSSRYLALIFARTMRKIKAKNVNTSTSERLQLVFRLAGRTNRRNNFSFSHNVHFIANVPSFAWAKVCALIINHNHGSFERLAASLRRCAKS